MQNKAVDWNAISSSLNTIQEILGAAKSVSTRKPYFSVVLRSCKQNDLEYGYAKYEYVPVEENSR